MKGDDTILAVDAGGTKTVIDFISETNCELEEIKTKKFPSADFDSLEDIIKEFLKKHGNSPQSAAFGILDLLKMGK